MQPYRLQTNLFDTNTFRLLVWNPNAQGDAFEERAEIEYMPDLDRWILHPLKLREDHTAVLARVRAMGLGLQCKTADEAAALFYERIFLPMGFSHTTRPAKQPDQTLSLF